MNEIVMSHKTLFDCLHAWRTCFEYKDRPIINKSKIIYNYGLDVWNGILKLFQYGIFKPDGTFDEDYFSKKLNEAKEHKEEL